MLPVDQTRFGRSHGNCLAACLASLLELPLAKVPTFTPDGWRSELGAWLKRRGLWFLQLNMPSREALAEVKGYAIVSGHSERGLLHATVWRGGEMVHDPHPSRAGILDIEDVIVLAPYSPAKAWRIGA